MKKRFAAFILCVVLSAFVLPFFTETKAFADANATASLSAETVKNGDVFEIIVHIKETKATAIGVEFSESESLTIESGEWLKKGALSDYDAAKKKGAFAPGTTAATSGDIFKLKLRVKDSAGEGSQNVSIRVIAKSGTTTLYDETFSKSVTVKSDADSPGEPTDRIDGTEPAGNGNTAAIVAGVAVGVALIAALIIILLVAKKNEKRSKSRKSGKK